jgi:hypothetical protein
MRTLEEVRALFPHGAVLECVENTYRPELNGSTRRVSRLHHTKLGVEVLTGPGTGKSGFDMALPARAGDVLELGPDRVKFRIRRGEHTVTLRVLP